MMYSTNTRGSATSITDRTLTSTDYPTNENDFSVRIDKEEDIIEIEGVNQYENLKFFDSSDLLNLLETVSDLVANYNSLKENAISPRLVLEPAKQGTGTTELAKELQDTSRINLQQSNLT